MDLLWEAKLKYCSLPPSQSLGHPHTAPTDLAAKVQKCGFKKAGDDAMAVSSKFLPMGIAMSMFTVKKPWITVPKLDPCSPHISRHCCYSLVLKYGW